MPTEITLFNMRTLEPNSLCVRAAPVAICGHCRHLVTIRNDSGRLFHYCGIRECSTSIIGCVPVKTCRPACRRYRPGRGEFLQANEVFTEYQKGQR